MTDDEMVVEDYVSPLCDNPCAPYDEYDKPCPGLPIDYYNNCKTDFDYSNFYNVIDWNKLYSDKDIIMCGFSDYLTLMLIDNEYFGNLFATVYNQVPDYGRQRLDILKAHVRNFPTMSPSRISNPNEALDYFKPRSITSDKGLCGDINFSFTINCVDSGAGQHELRIFHIALHSARSKKYDMVIDGITTRSQKNYTCGWYQNTDPDGYDSGPFHYKIDNVINRDSNTKTACNSNLPEEKAPFKKIIYDSYGSFYPMGQQEVFLNLDNDRTCNETLADELAKNPQGKKSKTKRYTVPRSFLNDQVNSLHRDICNFFIIFWNTKVLPNVSLPITPPPPSIFFPPPVASTYNDEEMDTGGNKNKLRRRKTKRSKTKRRKTKQRKTKRRKTKRRKTKK